MPSTNCAAVAKIEFSEKLKMLHAGNMQSENIAISNSSIWSFSSRKTFRHHRYHNSSLPAMQPTKQKMHRKIIVEHNDITIICTV